jgi:arginase
MRTLSIDAVEPGMVALVGVPWDEHSSFLRGAASAPAHIRAALASPSSNASTESGLDLGGQSRLVDCGEIVLAGPENPRDTIARHTADLVRRGARVLALGGDHAVTYPLVEGHRNASRRLTILHLDAHADLYDEFEGDRLSHACPFARIMEAGLAARLVQLGIRTMTAHLRQQAARFGVEVVEMKDWRADALPALDGDVYLSLDLDVLDPAFAPGVSHHEPGGLSTRDVLRIIQQFGGRLVGADVVELNPARDTLGITAMVAAKCVKEIAARLLENRPT